MSIQLGFVKLWKDKAENIFHGFFIYRETKQPAKIKGELINIVTPEVLKQKKVVLLVGDRAGNVIDNLGKVDLEEVESELARHDLEKKQEKKSKKEELVEEEAEEESENE